MKKQKKSREYEMMEMRRNKGKKGKQVCILRLKTNGPSFSYKATHSWGLL